MGKSGDEFEDTNSLLITCPVVTEGSSDIGEGFRNAPLFERIAACWEPLDLTSRDAAVIEFLSGIGKGFGSTPSFDRITARLIKF
jgi:hypothetical protein